jgi:[ribosomal protein S5]-alanine N-acetyltransferase
LRAPRSPRLDAEVPDRDRHLDFVARQLADPAVLPWHFPAGEGLAGGPRTRAQLDEMFATWERQQTERGFSWWPWRERTSGELVGLIGLNAAEIDGVPVVEVGWSVRSSRWGEGFAVEAARASLDWGFERCGLEEIVSFTMVENERSRRVMEKLGLEYVRDFDRLGLPHVLYRAHATET